MATWKELAFKDDVVALSTETPSAIGTSASAGVGVTVSKYDHVHILGAGVVDNSTVELNSNKLRIKDGGIDTGQIADDAVQSAKIGINAALNFNGHEIEDYVVHQATIGSPPTAVVGKWFQDSSTKKVYVCTAL